VSDSDFSRSRSTSRTCPECGGAVMRVLRSANDKRRWDADDWRRYRCRDDQCNWQGLLQVSSRRHQPQRPAHGAAVLLRMGRAMLWLMLAVGLGAGGLAALKLMTGV
jgi:hypothetical protein